MSRPLFAITDDMLRLEELFERQEDGGLAAGELDEAMEKYLAGLELEEAVKLEGCAAVVRQWEMEEAAAKAEAELYAMKARARAARVAWMKNRVKAHLTKTGRRKVTTSTGRTITVQANGGRPGLTIDPVTVELLPSRFTETVVQPDRAAIRAALDKTRELPGINGPITYTPENHIGQDTRGLAMLRLEGGKFVPVG